VADTLLPRRAAAPFTVLAFSRTRQRSVLDEVAVSVWVTDGKRQGVGGLDEARLPLQLTLQRTADGRQPGKTCCRV